MTFRQSLAMILLLGAVAACGDEGSGASDNDTSAADAAEVTDASGEIDAGQTLPDPTLWIPGPVVTPRSGFAAAHPSAFARVSGWATDTEPDTRPDPGHLGAYGIGNGHVFSLMGHAPAPAALNSLHGFTGPTYERRGRFFGDYQVRLARPGAAAVQPWTRERIAMSLSAPVVLTRSRAGFIEIETIDFAPWTDDPDLARCVVRVVTAINHASSASAPIEIRVLAHNKTPGSTADLMIEDTGTRTLVSAFVDGGGVDGQAIGYELGAIEAEGERTTAVLHCARDGADATPPPALSIEDAGALLDETAAAYQAWAAELVTFDLPDPMVADFLEGMKLTLRLSTAATGAVCPMSQYTRTWARDNIGPALAMLTLGGFDDVAGYMDYVYGAVLERGDLQNSYDADLALDPDAEPPDWDTMGPLSERVAAETPSYMVWIYDAWTRHTGQTARADARWGFLGRCLFAQGFSDEHLLPFTGDETFRAAMNTIYGYPVESPHHEESWSANSSFLWLGAAQGFMRLAEALGRSEDYTRAEALYADAEDSAVARYRLPDGCFSAMIDRATDEVVPEPFEDVSLKVTWAGWKPGDDEIAAENVACLVDRIGREPGVMQGHMAEMYEGPIFEGLFGASEGVYTGMLPGYVLSALTDTGHPDAAAAFNALRRQLSSSGNTQEYQIYDDHSGLTVFYLASGVEPSDYTGKYRPWEGGIVLDAALQYLIGFRPDASARTIALRPHLPNDWPSMGFGGLRVGDDRFDLEAARRGDEVDVTITSRAANDYTLTLRWDATSAPAIEVDGEAVAATDLTAREHFGVHSATTPAVTLPAGSELTFTVRP
jgi:hypothetical protein